MRVALVNLDDMQNADLRTAMSMLKEDLQRMQDAINTTWDVSHNTDGTQKSQFLALNGVFWGTLAQQPTGLTVADDKLQYYVTDFGHHVYWDGTAGQWKFAPGDPGAGFMIPRPIAPQEVGWQLCDGTATTYLVVGATLSAAAFTTPDLKNNASYLKSAATYSGTLNAKSGSTGTGSTGTGTTGTGTTGTGTTGTGTTSGSTDTTSLVTIATSDNAQVTLGSQTAMSTSIHTHAISPNPHSHTITGLSIPGLSVPGLSVPGLSVPALSIPALGAGSIEMANLGVPVYFRR